ncbi:hypothetical protein IFT48_02960 [Pseudomonas fluorescens]|uniref:hypothetical protein n=1 Tax=Pseudomonas fluorescens TaxID=294 RepID=UPI001930A3E0|nr:hypothetical protein [Pseudomonas fluorescens]MBD8088927.1 hypothetical protein [Pseudomonas fluorescens]
MQQFITKRSKTMSVTCASCGITTLITPALPEKTLFYLAWIDILYDVIMAGMVMMIVAGLAYGLLLSFKRFDDRKVAIESAAPSPSQARSPIKLE